MNKIILSSDFIAARKQQLLETLARLQARLKNLHPHIELGSDGGDGEVTVDEQVLEIELDDVTRAMISEIKIHLEKIEKALQKIEVGTYGSDDLGRPIPLERLEVFPEADTLT